MNKPSRPDRQDKQSSKHQQIETALQKNAKLLQLFIEHAPAALAMFDTRMHYIAVSQRWLQDYGLEDIDVINQSHYDIFPELPDTWKKVHQRALAGEVLSASHDRFKRSDGSILWLRWETRPWELPSGQLGGIIIFTEDITQQHLANIALKTSEARFRATFELAAIGIAHMDLDGNWLWANERLCSILGYSLNELKNRSLRDVAHPDDIDTCLAFIPRLLEGDIHTYQAEKRYIRNDGFSIWVNFSVVLAPTSHGNDKPHHFISVVEDITNRKVVEQQVHKAARHDYLTGLPNRRLVFEHGKRLLASAKRGHCGCTVMFIDLDRFKQINDFYGHEVGDRILQETSKRLGSSTRQEDLVGRIGGDEFIIILSHTTSSHPETGIVAQHALDSIAQPLHIGSLVLNLSSSIGISCYPEHGTDLDSLLHAADLAMYQAKKSGTGLFRFYTPELENKADALYQLEAKLRHAIKSGTGLLLHYQPVIDIASGKLMAVEALVRLQDGDALIPPDHFIPLAEATGLISKLGDWVTTEACLQHQRWIAQGLPPIPVAINVSPHQFKQAGFAEKLEEIFAATGASPGILQLEITESTLMENMDVVIEILQRTKTLGMKIALDDFGTGYSSLSLLSSLPLDKLKIDRSFIKRVGNDANSRSVTESIIALGHTLNLDIIAEGIETESTLDYLRSCGCNQAQGFLISRPLPADALAQWYQRYPHR